MGANICNRFNQCVCDKLNYPQLNPWWPIAKDTFESETAQPSGDRLHTQAGNHERPACKWIWIDDISTYLGMWDSTMARRRNVQHPRDSRLVTSKTVDAFRLLLGPNVTLINNCLLIPTRKYFNAHAWSGFKYLGRACFYSTKPEITAPQHHINTLSSNSFFNHTTILPEANRDVVN